MADSGESGVDFHAFPEEIPTKLPAVSPLLDTIATAVAAAVQAQADGKDPYEAAVEAVNNAG